MATVQVESDVFDKISDPVEIFIHQPDCALSLQKNQISEKLKVRISVVFFSLTAFKFLFNYI